MQITYPYNENSLKYNKIIFYRYYAHFRSLNKCSWNLALRLPCNHSNHLPFVLHKRIRSILVIWAGMRFYFLHSNLPYEKGTISKGFCVQKSPPHFSSILENGSGWANSFCNSSCLKSLPAYLYYLREQYRLALLKKTRADCGLSQICPTHHWVISESSVASGTTACM